MTQSQVTDSQAIVLKDVTLCAVSSSNIEATIAALMASLNNIEFADALLFTHAQAIGGDISIPEQIHVVPIEPIRSADSYSEFILCQLATYVETSHCLIVQWDGHVTNPRKWRDEFLQYDYIGASWPQFDDGFDVGNGGFSLRSKRLLEACQNKEFVRHHPEDVAICRTNRALLEQNGMRFAPIEIADQFSAERAGDARETFGYHGVFLMPEVLGVDRFWELYRSLDHRESVNVDFWTIVRKMAVGQNAVMRILALIANRLRG